jgi:hypothetical protein
MEQRVMRMRDATVRERDGGRYLEGYFAVFGEPYQVCAGWVETISPGAFARYLATGQDVKVLWNHDTNVVLGSTANGTASLREDETGLFGSVLINDKDQDAVNAHARVERGDVDGCSFGFEIARQEEWWDDDGVYHTRIMEVDPLYEVSPCTFPAYTSTSISARAAQTLVEAREKLERAQAERRRQWREQMLARVKGV